MKFPDFIIVGAAKSGTTALWYNLDKHPDITMATKTTESVEFNFWRGPCWKRGIDWYKSKFTGKVSGEKSVLYLNSKPSMRHIKINIPNVKLIACLRNPVDRAYSQWQMNNKANKVPDFSYSLFLKLYAKSGQYYNLINDNILPFFPKEQLHIIICEKMKRNTTQEMNKVFDFLEIPNLDFQPKEINPILRQNRTRQEDIKKNHKEKYFRVWSRHKGRLEGNERETLLNYYKPHNEKLFKFLGYEIKGWNK